MTTLFTANLIMNFAFGLGFTLVPGLMLSLYEANLSPEFIMMTRMFGLTLLSTCVVLWYARRSENQTVIELTSRANILYWLLGSIVILIAQINGLYNWVGWGTFGFHAFFFLWYAYKMFIRS